MKKLFLSLIAISLAVSTANAAGLITNTNQSASFLRNPARDAVIDIDGVYTNPAGVCFMKNGFHLGLSLQHPEQQRDITTTFQTLALNANYFGDGARLYRGEAKAPIVPSFQAAYVMDHWTFSASFAITGGGGKCEFNEGIGTVETAYSILPFMVASMLEKEIGVYAYTLDSYMKGSQYYYGVQLGAGYKFNDHISLFGGLRCVIGDATYSGYVHSLVYNPIDRAEKTQENTAVICNYCNTNWNQSDMTTKQSCVGWTPIVGVDWRINKHWNLAAKYEFRTKMNLKNSSDMNEEARSQGYLYKYNDEETPYVRDDIPGTLTVGVQYSPIDQVRLSGGYHWYDDCHAQKYDDEQELIEHGTREFLAGAEWDVNKVVTLSAGWQNTHYSLSDEYMQDMNYNLSSNLVGLGLRLNLTEKVSVDLGYMHNFYETRTVIDQQYASLGLFKSDTYERSNDVVAVGVNLAF